MNPSIHGHGNVIGDENTVTVIVNGREEQRLFVNVPPQPALLVGRDTLLSDLKTRLIQARSTATAGLTAALSAVHGLPGVGKTTLAAALAHDPDVLVHFGGGIFWGDLGPYATQAEAADSVLRLWADPLDVDVTAYPQARALAHAIGTALARRGQPALLILDDAWDWAPLAVLCEVDAPGSARLLTTRQPALARAFVGAAAVTDVEKLLLEESLTLLRALAPEAVALEPDAARELAKVTGGLPLALTLVGRTLAAESAGGHPRRIRETLTKLHTFSARFQHLPPGAERTLWAAIATSDEWVNDPRWYALGVLAPQPADFDEDAALAVLAADPPDAPEPQEGRALLDRLCDAGLLGTAGARYTLHQTLAEYAREQMLTPLPANDPRPSTAVERHARHYLALVNADRHDWRRIEAAWPQIRHAWTWVSAGKDADLVLEYVGALLKYQNMRGLWRVEMDWIGCGLEAARAVHRRKDEGKLLNNLAGVYADLGEQQRALETFQTALAIGREVGDRAGEGTTLNNIGRVYADLGDRQRALETYETALAIRREVGDRAGEGTTLNNIAGVYAALGEKQRALETYETALAIRREVGDWAGEGTTLNNIGLIYADLGDRQRALATYETALAILREVGDRSGESVTLYNMALIYRDQGEYRTAIEALEQVVALDEAVAHPDLESDRAMLARVRVAAAAADHA